MAGEEQTALGRVLEEQGRKRVWLARELGVSRQVLHRWEHGHLPTPVQRQAQIAHVLGVDRAELFEGETA